jgi:hypothetical protein
MAADIVAVAVLGVLAVNGLVLAIAVAYSLWDSETRTSR